MFNLYYIVLLMINLNNCKDELSKQLECHACFYLGHELTNRISHAHLFTKQRVFKMNTLIYNIVIYLSI